MCIDPCFGSIYVNMIVGSVVIPSNYTYRYPNDDSFMSYESGIVIFLFMHI